MAPAVHIKNAAVSYEGKVLFSSLDLHLSAGCFTALLGPSGVGKSSLLRMIAGLLPSASILQGSVYADNHVPVQQQIAYMAQTDLLLPWLSVFENATLSLRLTKHSALHKAQQQDKAIALLETVGLSKARHLYPAQLSGGMRQRTALVRTLLEDKPIILMDEPFSSLDAITRYKLQNLAAQMLKEKTVFFITHDPAEALRLAQDIYVLQGAPAKLKHLVHLPTMAPRELTETPIVSLQAQLFHELAQSEGECLL